MLLLLMCYNILASLSASDPKRMGSVILSRPSSSIVCVLSHGVPPPPNGG